MKKRISSEDKALWEQVIRSVKPLRKTLPKTDIPAVEEEKPRPRRKASATIAAPPVAPSRVVAPQKPPLAPLDRRTRKNISRGKHDIDGRIDLHGYRQAEAHAALLRFLRSLQAKGGKVALVITGKGGGSGDGEGRGVLRRQVPHWLALPEFRDYVIGFDVATSGHGGDGALYVRLRKKREA